MLTIHGWSSSRSLENKWLHLSITEAPDVVEPVTLDEVKSHLNIDFDDNNSYLTDLIKSCRQALEKFLGQSLVEKTITWIGDNNRGNSELPYGPVRGISNILDEDGIGLDVSVEFGKVITPVGWVQVVYTAGFTQVPADLKLEIMKMVAWEYAHRGDEMGDYKFSTRARAWRKVSSIN